jgi:hypothetical protein
MKAQIVVDVAFIFVACAPNLLHHNNIGNTFAKTSNFKMELVRSIPLYYVAMFQFMVTVIETPFIITLVHIVVGMKSRPLTSRGTELVSVHSVHTEMPKKVNKIFAS